MVAVEGQASLRDEMSSFGSVEAQNGALSCTGFDSVGDWRPSPLARPPTTFDWT